MAFLQHQLLALILLFQRRNRFVLQAYSSSLSPVESHIISEIGVAPGLRSSQIASAIKVDKSSLSRQLARLVKSKIITYCSESKAVVGYKLTKHGEKLLNLVEQNALENIKLFSSKLSADELNEFTLLFREVMDGLSAPEIQTQNDDNPIRTEMKRTSRVVGILNSKYLGTELNSFHAQVLWLIAEEQQNAALSQKDLAQLLAAKQSTLSRKLELMRKNGLIEFLRDSADVRRYRICLGARGREKLKALKEQAEIFYGRAIEAMGVAKIERFILLLTKFLTTPPELSHVKKSTKLIVLREASERELLRASFVEQAVRTRNYFCLPEALFPKEGLNFGVYLGERLIGGVGCLKKGYSWEIEIIFAIEAKEHGKVLSALFRFISQNPQLKIKYPEKQRQQSA